MAVERLVASTSAKMVSVSGELDNFDIVVAPVDKPTFWNNSPIRWLNLLRGRDGYVVTVYERGLTLPRYRQYLASQHDAEARARELQAVVRKGEFETTQSIWVGSREPDPWGRLLMLM
jgi:hypothetical protein